MSMTKQFACTQLEVYRTYCTTCTEQSTRKLYTKLFEIRDKIMGPLSFYITKDVLYSLMTDQTNGEK